MIRIMLVEDHTSFLDALAFMVNREPNLCVVARAASLAEARTALRHLESVDVAVVDLTLPDGHGVDLIGDLDTHTTALILTASLNPVEIAQAVEAGAAGVLHKTTSLDEIVRAIRRIAAGGWLMSPREVAEMRRIARGQREHDGAAQALLRQLTAREQEVLQALADGLDSRAIAQRMCITIPTVRTHVMNILTKLGVHTQLQALVFAVRHGAVEIH